MDGGDDLLELAVFIFVVLLIASATLAVVGFLLIGALIVLVLAGLLGLPAFLKGLWEGLRGRGK